MTDAVTELVELVGLYHRAYVAEHGDHGPIDELLHAQYDRVLATFQLEPDEPLEEAA